MICVLGSVDESKEIIKKNTKFESHGEKEDSTIKKDKLAGAFLPRRSDCVSGSAGRCGEVCGKSQVGVYFVLK